ncbi:MAG: transposase, partial [Bacteroidota bacterium]|nr:transposase [Bacteroidota bacterium]
GSPAGKTAKVAAKFVGSGQVLNKFTLYFFKNSSTYPSAESFNAMINDFGTTFRGVQDPFFFLFRLANILA